MMNGSGEEGDSSAEHWLTVWESSVANELESRTEHDIEGEKSAIGQKLWLSFQNTATAIAQVYVEKGNGGTEAFRNAARDATALYKEGLESGKRLTEFGITQGYNRRTKEIMQWARKRRRFIRRDELIAMLAGIRKPSPIINCPQVHHHSDLHSDHEDSDLATFRAAVSHRHPALSTLVTTEFQRVKRSSSPQQSDVHMDSPQPPKKTRFF